MSQGRRSPESSRRDRRTAQSPCSSPPRAARTSRSRERVAGRVALCAASAGPSMRARAALLARPGIRRDSRCASAGQLPEVRRARRKCAVGRAEVALHAAHGRAGRLPRATDEGGLQAGGASTGALWAPSSSWREARPDEAGRARRRVDELSFRRPATQPPSAPPRRRRPR